MRKFKNALTDINNTTLTFKINFSDKKRLKENRTRKEREDTGKEMKIESYIVLGIRTYLLMSL